MIQAKCIQKIRDNSGKICGYTLIDLHGKIMHISSAELKMMLTKNDIQVLNLKLTKDNRIISIESESKDIENKINEYEDKHNKKINDYIEYKYRLLKKAGFDDIHIAYKESYSSVSDTLYFDIGSNITCKIDNTAEFTIFDTSNVVICEVYCKDLSRESLSLAYKYIIKSLEKSEKYSEQDIIEEYKRLLEKYTEGINSGKYKHSIKDIEKKLNIRKKKLLNHEIRLSQPDIVIKNGNIITK